MCTNHSFYLLNPHRDALIQEEIVRLRELHAPRYREIELYALKQRAVRLVEAFLASLKEGPMHFVKFIDHVAKERFPEGYSLEEIQSALNILTEKAWEITVREVPLQGRDRVLSLISGTIGAAKDQLARVYFRELERSESRMARLEESLNELAAGTISPPDLTEEDLPSRGR
ncbi:MAG: hypothetical protein ABIK28_17375 [Planctomycetota bacterium]